MKRIEKILSIVLKPIRENFIFFVFLYVLGILTMMIEVWTLHFSIQRFNFFSWILDLYLLCLLLTILPRVLKKWLKFLVAFVLYSLSIINSFCVYKFYSKIGTEILNVVLETNPTESSEFIDKYINLDLLQSGVGVIIILLFLHVLFESSLGRFKKKILNIWGQ